MTSPYIIGENVFLRPLLKEDLNDRYLSWLNDPDVRRYLEAGLFPSTPDDLLNFYDRIAKDSSNVVFAICLVKNNLHVGNIKLGPINFIHRKATVGIMIGDKREWGKNIGTESMRLVTDYGFNTLNLHRIELGVCADHCAAIHCYEKAGFRIEGRLRDAAFHEGRYKDNLIMAAVQRHPGLEFMESRRNHRDILAALQSGSDC